MSRHQEPAEPPESVELAALRAEIDQAERDVVRLIEPGIAGVVIAVAVVVLLVAALLPWVGGVIGWRVLLGQTDPRVTVGLLPRMFGGTALGFGVFGSALALITRRWGLAWTCTLGCWFSVVDGVLAIWTQQATRGHIPGPGPGAGLVLAVLAVAVLGAQWFRLSWSRP